MLGKNRGRRRGGKARRLDDESSDIAKHSSTPSSSDAESRSVVPVRVGSDCSLLKLAAAVEPILIRNFLTFAYNSKASMFPLEPCIAFKDHGQQWVAPVAYDAMFLHATIFASQAALGRGSSRDTNGSVASQHFGKAVHMLRLRIEGGDPALTTADTTVMVMVILAISALLSGQEDIARHHMTGVKRVVEIRGGFASFSEAVKLLIEVLRCDIGLTLSTGQPPLFFHRPFSGPHMDIQPVQRSSVPRQGGDSFETLVPMLDGSLTKVWRSLRDFCKTVNAASNSHRRLSDQAVLDNMASNIYPLLNLRYGCGSPSETCRLGLLAFCSNAFLQWQGLNLNYKSLPSLYRGSLLGLVGAEEDVPSQAVVWLLMMGGIALFTGEEDQLWLLPWLHEVIDECALSSWEETKDMLKSFLWVHFIHDEPGQRLYVAAMARDVP